MSNSVLFVDDEPAVLDGYRRLLGREVDLETAVGGTCGLDAIARSGPYGVVVSDMRMPQMDGACFLARVRELAPATVRMALTGYADIETAMNAVNEGNIFRFLTKPCSRVNLLSAVEAALAQHRLILAEKELLEGTLRSCVSVLAEMLSFSNPAAFGRAMRLRHFVRHAAQKLKLASAWNFEIAAMLSQLGCVTLGPELVNAAYAGEPLSPEDQKKLDGHAEVAGRMLRQIPRLEAIAQMIAQQSPSPQDTSGLDAATRRDVEFGSQLLRVGLAYDVLITRGASPEEARRAVRSTAKGADPSILALLDDFELHVPVCTRECRISDLTGGMILQQDIRTDTGMLIVAKGQELSFAWIDRLKDCWHRDSIPGRLLVQVPDTIAEQQSAFNRPYLARPSAVTTANS